METTLDETSTATQGAGMWEKTTEENYERMLCVLPPEFVSGMDFLLGEPQSHRRCRITGAFKAVYAGFTKRGGEYFATSEALTKPEFDVLRLSPAPNTKG